MSSLVYKGDHKDFNKTLKCEVDHKGHTETHLEDENNIAKAVLNLRFDLLKNFLIQIIYRTRAIITLSLYIFYPIFQCKRG